MAAVNVWTWAQNWSQSTGLSILVQQLDNSDVPHEIVNNQRRLISEQYSKHLIVQKEKSKVHDMTLLTCLSLDDIWQFQH